MANNQTNIRKSLIAALNAISTGSGDSINVKTVRLLPDPSASMPVDEWPLIAVLPGDRTYVAHPPGQVQVDWQFDLLALCRASTEEAALAMGEGIEKDIKRTVFANARSPQGGSIWSIDCFDFRASSPRSDDPTVATVRVSFKIRWREGVDEAP